MPKLPSSNDPEWSPKPVIQNQPSPYQHPLSTLRYEEYGTPVETSPVGRLMSMFFVVGMFLASLVFILPALFLIFVGLFANSSDDAFTSTVQGTVSSVQEKLECSGEGTNQICEQDCDVRYSYTVGDKTYLGQSDEGNSYFDGEQISACNEVYGEGTDVKVYYDPNIPAESSLTLLSSVRVLALVGLAVMLPGLVLLGAAIWIYRTIAKKKKPLPTPIVS